jgi:hypothetical protein
VYEALRYSWTRPQSTHRSFGSETVPSNTFCPDFDEHHLLPRDIPVFETYLSAYTTADLQVQSNRSKATPPNESFCLSLCLNTYLLVVYAEMYVSPYLLP